MAGETGVTKSGVLLASCREHTVQREIAQAVDSQELADLLD
jgi:hypothetical protein